MNREIKFRAWDGKEMHQDVMIFDGSPPDLRILEFDETGTTEKSVISIQQFTGLKDKNDKEIYEGDIVKTVQGVYKMQGVVKYSAPSYYVYDNFGANVLEYYEWEQLEIIGNIHKNPELLNGT